MSRLRLLDLFCGAGGAGMGYYRAGFEVVGVDIKPMPRYPFEFHQADALEFLAEHGHEFDAIHASPPCQRYSIFSRNLGLADQHPDLIAPTRDRLARAGKPYVIENVAGAPLDSPAMLCGSWFGLQTWRHRYFESTIFLWSTPCRHVGIGIPVYGGGTPQWHRKKYGRNVTDAEKRSAMGIDWMNRKELSQAIPPAYTEFIGEQLIRALEAA